MLEKVLIQHCAPTLAGIKVSNLICCDCCYDDIESIRYLLFEKGINIHILRHTGRKLIFIYRKNLLENILLNKDNQNFLRAHGHFDFSLEGILFSFEEKLKAGPFPHEIGLLLGYPLEDVKGFIENDGAYSIAQGCWKVYGDCKIACDIFARYKQCTEVYLNKYKMGCSLAELAVAT